jgi:hypothetical protein
MKTRMLMTVLGGGLQYWQHVKNVAAGSLLWHGPGWEPSGTTLTDIVGGANLDYHNCTLGSVGIGDGRTSFYMDGATSYIGGNALNAIFPVTAGWLMVWALAGAGIWTDNAEREIFRLVVGADLMYIRKNTSNQIQWRTLAGGVGSAPVKAATPAGWTCYGLTWGGGTCQPYYHGDPEGAPFAIGTFSGQPTLIAIGGMSNYDASGAWKGGVAHVAFGNQKLPDAKMKALVTYPF